MKNSTKKILTCLLVIACLATLVAVLTGCNPSYESTGLNYKIEGDEVSIVGYTDSTLRDTVVVPDEIDGKPVTKIANFGLCNAETLKSITIGKNVKEIGTWALTNNQGLKEFKVAEGNEYFTSLDGVLYTKDMKEIVAFPPLKGVEMNSKMERTNKDQPVVCVIPEGVEKIRAKAFYKCYYVSKVEIPSTVVVIEEKAFHNCVRLEGVTLPEGLKSIEKDAFSYCFNDDETFQVKGAGINYVTVTIPAGVETIGEYAFYNCKYLLTINVGKTEAERVALEEKGTWGKKWYPTDNGRVRKDINYVYSGPSVVPESKKLGVGAIIGIVVGCVAAVALVGVGVFFFLKKKKDKKKKAAETPVTEEAPAEESSEEIIEEVPAEPAEEVAAVETEEATIEETSEEAAEEVPDEVAEEDGESQEPEEN